MTTPDTSESAPHSGSLFDSCKRLAASASGRRTLMGLAACAGLIAAIFQTNISHFVHMWSTDDNYSHGFLVPFLALYFADRAARRGGFSVHGGFATGIILVAIALVAKTATIVVPVGFIGDLALPTAIAGVCSILCGREGLKRFGFAIGFLAFMIPLPVALYSMIANPLQLSVSGFAARIMNGCGIPVLREGNMMTLPGDVRMFVAEACSGLRQLTGFLALTAAAAYLSKRPLWDRAILFASAVPVAMIANIARVVVTGMIMYWIDPKYAAGTFHSIEGLLLMGLGLALLAGLSAALGAIGGLAVIAKVDSARPIAAQARPAS